MGTDDGSFFDDQSVAGFCRIDDKHHRIRGAFITNEETHEKLEISLPMLYPTVSVCVFAYTMALPASQTAEGCANIDSLCFRRRCRIQKIMKLVQISCGLLC